jgi:hypothetical protein
LFSQAAVANTSSTITSGDADLFELLQLCLDDEDDDDDEDIFFNGMYEYAVHAEKHLSRAPYRQHKLPGLEG